MDLVPPAARLGGGFLNQAILEVWKPRTSSQISGRPKIFVTSPSPPPKQNGPTFLPTFLVGLTSMPPHLPINPPVQPPPPRKPLQSSPDEPPTGRRPNPNLLPAGRSPSAPAKPKNRGTQSWLVLVLGKPKWQPKPFGGVRFQQKDTPSFSFDIQDMLTRTVFAAPLQSQCNVSLVHDFQHFMRSPQAKFNQHRPLVELLKKCKP